MYKEWLKEKDVKEFMANGYKCIVKRHKTMKHLCGYVHITKSHKLYGIGYSNLYDMNIDIEVHGGLTYAEKENEDWVFGFDCAHLGDLVPGMEEYGIIQEEEIYRNMEYVEHETRHLANQLKGLEK